MKLQQSAQKYADLETRIDGAKIELDIAKTAHKYRFSIVRPAEVSKRPHKPNPVALFAGVVFLDHAHLVRRRGAARTSPRFDRRAMAGRAKAQAAGPRRARDRLMPSTSFDRQGRARGELDPDARGDELPRDAHGVLEGEGATAEATEKLPFFDVIVPAHDEEQNIAATVVSLLAVDYPRNRFRVVVVADNCTDKTAERAREAGADVIERVDATKRGKGYALASRVRRVARARRSRRGRRGRRGHARHEEPARRVRAPHRRRRGRRASRVRRAQPGCLVANAADGDRHVALPHGALERARAPRCVVRPTRQRHGRSRARCFARSRTTRSRSSRTWSTAFASAKQDTASRTRRRPPCSARWSRRATRQNRSGSAGSAVAQSSEGKHGWRLVKRGLVERNAMLFDLGADLLVPPLSKIGVAIVSARRLAIRRSR